MHNNFLMDNKKRFFFQMNQALLTWTTEDFFPYVSINSWTEYACLCDVNTQSKLSRLNCKF